MKNTLPPSGFVPLDHLIRIRVTGRDRSRFLHNFCTNNINQLPAGMACEAFFTDMRARVLAHGWILAGHSDHEIWMLPGDEQRLLQHLNRYVITEDVCFQSVTDSCQAVVVPVSQLPHTDFVPSIYGCVPSADYGWTQSAGDSGDPQTRLLKFVWCGDPFLLISASADGEEQLKQKFLLSGYRLTEPQCFECLRIADRYPICGIDITDEHMAPEADRNTAAISYTKGCYLGQEPIARLDAMGHVNRSLRSFRIAARPADLKDAAIYHEQHGIIGRMTSIAEANPDADEPCHSDKRHSLAMGVVRVHGIDLSSGLTAINKQQQVFQASLLSPHCND